MHVLAILATLPLVTCGLLENRYSSQLKSRDDPATKDMYIVYANSNDHHSLDRAISSAGVTPRHVYHSLRAFALEISGKELQRIKRSPHVNKVVRDKIITQRDAINRKDHKTYQFSNAEQNRRRTTRDAKLTTVTQGDNVPWNLARLSHFKPHQTSYTYDQSAGTGACVYVIDSGLLDSHPEFGGRAKLLENFSGDPDFDIRGRGTYIAGIVGSNKYGVAKNATIFGIKVMDDKGNTNVSTILAGMDFVMSDAPKRKCPSGVVVNISLVAKHSKSLNDAAGNMVKSGIFLAVAAGDDGRNAEKFSPASQSIACTVGATNKDDEFASYSNRGSYVNVLAPGTDVVSLTTDASNQTSTLGRLKALSGTFAASPHVAGLGAYLLGLGTNVTGLCHHISSTALQNVVVFGSGNYTGTPNRLINNGFK
ncbi:hypothetical protein QQS21_004883 [Conoideocrella luteorostrata]|uniref:Uncharacterized protein n=1 Tax=Conoideocrella luteorostrata TaxID=1105319 RepID=A0AAJ0CSZ6_9HYPO|nr:hypothetical protein QQS21_004883 [Conoideocrella luteorostrata]